MKQKTITIIFASAIVLFGMKATSARAEDGLVAHWDFHEGSGNILHDVSGNRNEGTIQGAIWIDGKIGKALDFDGADDRVEIADSESLDLANNYTLEAWIYPKSDPGYAILDGIITKGGIWDTNAAYQLYHYPQSNNIQGNLRWGEDANSQVSIKPSFASVNQEEWSHVALVGEGKVLKIYVNGEIRNILNMPDGTNLKQNDLPVWLGGAAGTDGGGRYYHGIIDEARIYNRTLSTDEIRSHVGIIEKSKLKKLIHVGFADDFLVKSYQDITEEKMEAVSNSPFDGYAVIFADKMSNCRPVPSVDSYQAQISAVKKSNKEIWPRLIFPLQLACHDGTLNLWDDVVMEQGFSMVRNAVQVAKETGAEGIFIDPENYKTFSYDVREVGSSNGKSAEEAIARMEEIGARMADEINAIAGSERFHVWSAFVPFTKDQSGNFTYSPDYIFSGFLKQAKEKDYNIILIDGGEASPPGVGYNHLSQDTFDFKSARGYEMQKSWLSEYSNNFKLSATTTMYPDFETSCAQWVKNQLLGYTFGELKIHNIDDFEPLLRSMFGQFEYAWIYRDGGIPNFDDFNPNRSSIYRPVIQRSLCANNICDLNRGETSLTCPADCASFGKTDLNQDTKIDSSDLEILKTDFLKLTANLSNPRSDINSDGQCTARDLGILMSGWGK